MLNCNESIYLGVLLSTEMTPARYMTQAHATLKRSVTRSTVGKVSRPVYAVGFVGFLLFCKSNWVNFTIHLHFLTNTVQTKTVVKVILCMTLWIKKGGTGVVRHVKQGQLAWVSWEKEGEMQMRWVRSRQQQTKHPPRGQTPSTLSCHQHFVSKWQTQMKIYTP